MCRSQINLYVDSYAIFLYNNIKGPISGVVKLSSHLILSHLILSYLILSYLILSYLILSYLISSYLILSYLILSYLILVMGTPAALPLTTRRWQRCSTYEWSTVWGKGAWRRRRRRRPTPSSPPPPPQHPPAPPRDVSVCCCTCLLRCLVLSRWDAVIFIRRHHQPRGEGRADLCGGSSVEVCSRRMCWFLLLQQWDSIFAGWHIIISPSGPGRRRLQPGSLLLLKFNITCLLSGNGLCYSVYNEALNASLQIETLSNV